MSSLTDKVALTVLDFFSGLSHKLDPNEFTVLCGIVAEVQDIGLKPICVTTGTKCYNSDREEINFGAKLSDSHAEVLARRAFVSYLMKCVWACLIDTSFERSTSCPIETTIENTFKVKDSYKFWLYVSDSPCGDASIYLKSSGQMSFTGAKPLLESRVWAREDDQSLGILRTKPGRSDIQPSSRSTSMSCSDKLCLWNYAGLQGALLAYLIPFVGLSGVVVSADPDADHESQLAALKRALWNRGNNNETSKSDVAVNGEVQSQLQTVELAVTDHCFEQSKSMTEHMCRVASSGSSSSGCTDELNASGLKSVSRKRKYVESGERGKRPSGTSSNWISNVHKDVDRVEATGGRVRQYKGGTLELTQALTGVLLGVTKAPKTLPGGRITGMSRLCRRELSRVFVSLISVARGVSAQLPLVWENVIRSVGSDDDKREVEEETNDEIAKQTCPPVAGKSIVSYLQCKRHSAAYRTRKQLFFSTASFRDWQRSNRMHQDFPMVDVEA